MNPAQTIQETIEFLEEILYEDLGVFSSHRDYWTGDLVFEKELEELRQRLRGRITILENMLATVEQ